MASRLLLTLLALLTGLSAQTSPARAGTCDCVADRAAIGALASANAVQEQRAIAVRAIPQARGRRVGGAPLAALSPAPWRAPTVLTGIDRARE